MKQPLNGKASPQSRRWFWILLILVLGFAAVSRWWRFSTLPPGLWYDEAYHLAEGQALAQGEALQLYYPQKTGEPAIFWFTALALKLGADHLAPRWITTSMGLLSVLLLFLAARSVLRRELQRPEWVALASAAALSVNFAFLLNSRIGWEPVLLTTATILTVWFFWLGLRSGRVRDFAIAGLCLGCSQYTGVGARILPFVLFLVFLGWLGSYRDRWRQWLKGLLTTAALAVLVYLPLALTFLSNPTWFGRRLETAATTSELLGNLGHTLAGLAWSGEVALHGLPGRPLLNPMMALLLVVGVLIAMRRIKRPAYNVWLAWAIGFLPAGMLSSPAPVFYRIVPAVPAIATLCALGAWYLVRKAANYGPRAKASVTLLLCAVFVASAWITSWDYFYRWANWPRLPAVMDVGKWLAADTIVQTPENEILFVTIPDGREPAITYAIHARTASPVRAFDGANCLVYPDDTDAPIHYVSIWGQEHHSLPRLQALYPTGQYSVDPAFGDGAPYFVNFRVPAGGDVSLPGKLSQPISYGPITLTGMSLSDTEVTAGQPLSVTLVWNAREPIHRPYTAFVHLLDARLDGPTNALKAQHDGPPCAGTERTDRWQPGEHILDEHILQIPLNVPPGEYMLAVGLYDSETGERLHPSGEGMRLQWGEVIVQPVRVLDPYQPGGE